MGEHFTGIEAIMAEREKQLYKQYDANHDDEENKGEKEGVMLSAALYLLTNDEHYYPMSWGKPRLNRWGSYSRLKQIAIAGALLAAEYDRIQRKEITKEIAGNNDTTELTGQEG